MFERIYFRPIIPLLIVMIFGIVLGSRFSCNNIWAYSTIFLCVVLVFIKIKYKKSLSFLPLIIFFVLGYLLIKPWIDPGFSSSHITSFTDKNPWEIVGTVDKSPEFYDNRLKIILSVETLGRDNSSFTVAGKIRVTVTKPFADIFVGDRLFLISKIRSIRNFNNPGRFDYKRYMGFKKIWGSAYISGKRLVVLDRNSVSGFNTAIEKFRSKISSMIDETGREDKQSVLKALIVGDKTGISQNIREAFNRSGTGHLLAISGLHVGIIATASFMFFRRLLSYIKLFLWNGWIKKGAAVLSLFPVILYGLISGMSPSTQRALIMVIVFLMSFLFEREEDSINTLAIAAMLILIIHPPSLFSISFQLSFSAVFLIICGWPLRYLKSAGIKETVKKKWHTRITGSLFSFLLVSFFAILGTLPIVMFYFNQVSTVGLISNLLMVPAIGFIVVPLGLIAVLLSPLSISGALIFVKTCNEVLAYALSIVNYIAGFSFAAIKTITPSFFEICCYYLLIWAILQFFKSGVFARQSKAVMPVSGVSGNKMSQGDTGFRRKTVLIVAALVVFAASVDACYWLYERFWRNDLRVTVIDVGQGSSALLELPGGRCFLVDGGGFSDNSIFDVGARIVAPVLWRKKIKTIDTIILSHPNADHLNGLIYIARYFNVKRLWCNSDFADTSGYRELRRIAQKNNIETVAFKDMQRVYEINGAKLNILYPPKDYSDKAENEKWRNLNNNSIVLKVSFGSKSILFPGDIMARAEKELVAICGDELKSTVLVAPHHGSSTSSTDAFLEKTRPETVIISMGWKNRFGFPHASVLKRYNKNNCQIFRTDKNGALALLTDGRSLKVRPFITSSSEPLYPVNPGTL